MKNYTSQVYKIIKELVDEYGEIISIKYLCEIAEVSRSGYYNYFSKKSIYNRMLKEEKDLKDREMILDAFNRHGYKKGAKGIKMTLENEDGIVFNLKHIRRIMKKYHIVCPIRKPNPYKQMLKANLEHRTLENTLNREFKQEIPGKVLLTDITYLTYGFYQRAYLSTIKDASTTEILAYRLSTNLYLDFVLKTMWDLKKKKDSIGENSNYDIYPELDNNGLIYEMKFISKFDNTPNRELSDTINSYLWLDNNNFLYSKKGKGMYVYNLETGTVRRILTGTEDYELKGFENGILKYDDTEIEFQY